MRARLLAEKSALADSLDDGGNASALIRSRDITTCTRCDATVMLMPRCDATVMLMPLSDKPMWSRQSKPQALSGSERLLARACH